ncbi:MAG: hypothetical protein SPK50_02925 [Mobiluncus porci]|uniref:hypothetical protein n=1 Tax=Mobiluncus porci TaxID=2652278 RepID=UPI0023F0D7C7|nr:hypothetical protein [Mobiluncus porci]MDD7541181.1 hypothetical protein [Mobiluncus porci]MDY5748070.1 hypothetical protein [Mobiluncus porci]
MITYSWPPLPETDLDRLQADILDALDGAWANAQEERAKILALKDTAPRVPYRRALERVDRFEYAIQAFQDTVDQQAQNYVDLISGRYGAGAMQMAGWVASGKLVWGNMDEYALASLASDSYDDFLRMSQEAGRTSKLFANKVRSAAARTVWTQATNETATHAARRFWKELEALNIGVITYRNGAQYPAKAYAEMAARTKGAVAFNYGALDVARAESVTHMEVVDGPSCGWESHNSTDYANGSIRTIEECREYPLSHPNCRRAFLPLSATMQRIVSEAEAAEALGEEYETELFIPALERYKETLRKVA